MSVPFAIEPLPEPEPSRLRRFLAGLPAPVDSFVEDYLLTARHVALRRDGRRIGSAAVAGEDLLVHYGLEPAARAGLRAGFDHLTGALGVRAVLTPTCDEWLLACALDRMEELRLQATLFREAAPDALPEPRNPDLILREAEPSDLDGIQAMIGSFLPRPELERLMRDRGIHGGWIADELVSLGILEPPRLLPACASIGMFTHADHRRRGIATDTLLALRRLGHARGWQPVAGCAYGNTGSWHALERAGMVAGTRLVHITLTAIPAEGPPRR